MRQTKVTDSNKEDFYKVVYPVSAMSKDRLLNIEDYPGTKVIVDSAGLTYQLNFPSQNIIKIEKIQTCKEFQFNKNHFDKLYKDDPNFPVIKVKGTLILDHSPLLKYKTETELKQVIKSLTECIYTETVVLRMAVSTMGDYRFTDRIRNLINFIPDNFLIENLNYDSQTITVRLKRKKVYDFD